MAGTAQVQAHYSKGYHVLFDKDKISQHHPESMAKGYIGGGKMITGHDHMGNPVIEACRPNLCG